MLATWYLPRTVEGMLVVKPDLAQHPLARLSSPVLSFQDVHPNILQDILLASHFSLGACEFKSPETPTSLVVAIPSASMLRNRYTLLRM